MNIERSRKFHYFYSGELSKATLYSNYTGLAILWLFYSTNSHAVFFDEVKLSLLLLWAFVFFLLSIVLHMLGNLYSCIYWQWTFRLRECAFYHEKDIQTMKWREKLRCWKTSVFGNLDITKIDETKIKAFESAEFHVGEKAHLFPYACFYVKIILCILGYVFLLSKIIFQ